MCTRREGLTPTLYHSENSVNEIERLSADQIYMVLLGFRSTSAVTHLPKELPAAHDYLGNEALAGGSIENKNIKSPRLTKIISFH